MIFSRKNHSFVLYSDVEDNVRVEVLFQDETLWLTQKQMAELFGVKVPAISKHLKIIFAAGELSEEAVISILETTASDGKKYKGTRDWQMVFEILK